MKVWFDTEFIEDGKAIDLISIGIVAEDGREYYAVSNEFNARKASQWVKDNVLVHLPRRKPQPHPNSTDADALALWKPRKQIAQEIVEFVGEKPEFWGYYADYDWVVLCWLYGTMMDLPKGWPMYCRDLKQWCDMLGNPRLPEQGKGEHHALADARWNKQAWEFLATSEKPATPPQVSDVGMEPLDAPYELPVTWYPAARLLPKGDDKGD